MSGFETMRAMIAMGMTDDQKLALIAAMEADAKPKDRTAAERQARHRDKIKAERDTVTRDVTRDDVTANPSPQSPPLKSPPDPQKITPPLTPQPAVVVGRAIPKFDPPEGVTAEQFKAFRQQRKKPLSAHSYGLLCNKLRTLAEAGWPPGEMIDLAIERGWETVFEPKDRVNGRSNTLRGSRPSPALDMLKRAAAEEAAERGGEADYRGTRPALPPVRASGP